eukprot:CAMPEP_0175058514 /NCGR_PEP_ID=MMETSP0052_2-20121109/11888_1 /TAXON_ID=51329 ORGANISM="Polytomella parva, Strain SAG 63-3" /NCGR_SAMPLE_ID=MMETSP0052_2 /ASSEMBLY_ACC=CAM_ASM_000194 /LENGTH=759 /DNA_ID=CAMNT_0016323899 /DNA_START=17 /DNA_END=2292 /DNA_ORIENTATION=-
MTDSPFGDINVGIVPNNKDVNMAEVPLSPQWKSQFSRASSDSPKSALIGPWEHSSKEATPKVGTRRAENDNIVNKIKVNNEKWIGNTLDKARESFSPVKDRPRWTRDDDKPNDRWIAEDNNNNRRPADTRGLNERWTNQNPDNKGWRSNDRSWSKPVNGSALTYTPGSERQGSAGSNLLGTDMSSGIKRPGLNADRWMPGSSSSNQFPESLSNESLSNERRWRSPEGGNLNRPRTFVSRPLLKPPGANTAAYPADRKDALTVGGSYHRLHERHGSGDVSGPNILGSSSSLSLPKRLSNTGSHHDDCPNIAGTSDGGCGEDSSLGQPQYRYTLAELTHIKSTMLRDNGGMPLTLAPAIVAGLARDIHTCLVNYDDNRHNYLDTTHDYLHFPHRRGVFGGGRDVNGVTSPALATAMVDEALAKDLKAKSNELFNTLKGGGLFGTSPPNSSSKPTSALLAGLYDETPSSNITASVAVQSGDHTGKDPHAVLAAPASAVAGVNGVVGIPPHEDAVASFPSTLVQSFATCDAWLYKDPKGRLQGPFTKVDILDWFEAGFFNDSLPVKPAYAHDPANPNADWQTLGVVMRQWNLLLSGRVPPGFLPAQGAAVAAAAAAAAHALAAQQQQQQHALSGLAGLSMASLAAGGATGMDLPLSFFGGTGGGGGALDLEQQMWLAKKNYEGGNAAAAAAAVAAQMGDPHALAAFGIFGAAAAAGGSVPTSFPALGRPGGYWFDNGAAAAAAAAASGSWGAGGPSAWGASPA